MVIDGREVDGQPIARVRYLFTYEREARAHLHAMWLRELEVWTFIDAWRHASTQPTCPRPTIRRLG